MLDTRYKCYVDGDKRRPIPPHREMSLGFGSGKDLSEWVRLHMALNSSPPKSTYVQLSKPTHIVWRCAGTNCPWYLVVKRRMKEDEWFVSDFRDMHINCDGVCKPTAKDLGIIIPELLYDNTSIEETNQYLTDRGIEALSLAKMYRARREVQHSLLNKRQKVDRSVDNPDDSPLRLIV